MNATRNFDTVFSDRVQQSAFGKPGEPGDVDQILHVASRYISIYESFMDWATRLRSYATPSEEARAVLEALAMYAQQPVERLRGFAYEYRDIDTITAKITAGKTIVLQLEIKLEISPAATARYHQALRRLEQLLRTRE